MVVTLHVHVVIHGVKQMVALTLVLILVSTLVVQQFYSAVAGLYLQERPSGRSGKQTRKRAADSMTGSGSRLENVAAGAW